MPKYWTGFGFENYSISDLHCTHKYLGELPVDVANDLCGMIDFYFRFNPFQSFTVDFSRPELFGINKDIRVLTPALDTPLGSPRFLIDLREYLNQYRKDDFPEYRPHVTTQADRVFLPFTRYCFMEDSYILKEWK